MLSIEIKNGKIEIFVTLSDGVRSFQGEFKSLTEAAKEAHFLVQHYGLTPNTILGTPEIKL
jgi:hypothetical protein